MSSAFQREIDQLIRARYTLLYVVTWEEERARRLIAEVAASQGKPLFEWSVTDGLRQISGTERGHKQGARLREPLKVLNEILQASDEAIYVLKDFHSYLESPDVIRQVRDLGQSLRRSRKSIILLSPTVKIPVELEKAVTLVDLPLPSYKELGALLNQKIDRPAGSRRFDVQLSAADRDAMIKAAQGLTLAEAENAYAKAIVRDSVLNSEDIEAIIEEKKQIVRKSGLLDFYAVDGTIEGVGGMDTLKDWLGKRARAFSKEAREYGLPQPRGILLIGVQGCGKSLVAKSVASFWRLPLLRLDMSRIFQGYIGSSEENMRRALEMGESLSPIILWIDEIEKAF
jgi:SpoVK/Ycf46/Vps4 family AAA+-type ATPase